MEHFRANSGSLKLPAPIGFVSLQEAVGIVGKKMGADADIERAIAERCETGEIAAAYRTPYGAEPLDPAVWRMPHWRNYFADGMIELILPLLDERDQPNVNGFTARCPREIFIRSDSLDRLDRFVAGHPAPAPSPTARRRGRPPVYDWSAIERTVWDLMYENGDFSADDNWNAQARLEEALNDKFGVEKSALRERLPPMLQSWRADKAGK